MKKIGFLILICVFTSCHSQSEQSAAENMSYLENSKYTDGDFDDNSNGNSNEVEKKIIKTAELKFQVKDIDISTTNINAITNNFSGSIANMSQINNNYNISNNITVRIPAAKLDDFLKAIEKESIFTDYKQISSQDVTEEFLDITTRLNTKKEVRDRYIEILRNKAKTVEDILNAEEKIRVIQEEIESIEGRIKYINNKSSLSTVLINIYQEVEYVSSPTVYKKSFGSKLKEGFVSGWLLIQNIIIGLITIWPITLFALLVIIFRKRLFSAFRK